jgi:SprT protein
MEDQHIREWIRFACERNGVPQLAQKIVVEWNSRFTRRLADGMWSATRKLGRIRLSSPLWGRVSEEEQRTTVIHETCHVIVFRQHGNAAPHGPEWRQAMRNCGLEPISTHNVDRTGLARKQRRFILCDCPRETKCRISARVVGQLRAGRELWCEKCGLRLDRNAAVEEERALQKL